MRLSMLFATVIAVAAVAQEELPTPAVEVEEEIYTLVPPDNGSGPLWSFGCTPIARVDDDVVVSQMETGADVPKLCNTRWRLLRRVDGAWKCFAEAEGYRQREPTLLAVLPGRRLYLNVNDSTQPPGTMYGPTDPHLLRFDGNTWPAEGAHLSPTWVGTPSFTDHSYRSYAADRAAEQLVMFNIDAKTSVQNWCLMTGDGATVRNGQVTFPIRSCYQQSSLKNGACHILAIGDIVEPVEEWRQYKFEQTQQNWDYVFRVLYYAWTPDLAKQDFAAPIEIANVDSTCGHIFNQDLWVSPDGEAHLLYLEREVQNELMHDKFFPDKSLNNALKLAVVKDGQVVRRHTYFDNSGEQPVGHARFHETPDGKVYALMYMGGANAGNKLMQVHPFLENPALVDVPFERPFVTFLLANERAGNEPSNTIDVLGHRDRGDSVCYGRIRLSE